MKVLKTIFGDGASKLVESVGGVLDNLSTSKEEKLEARTNGKSPGRGRKECKRKMESRYE
jgi:hypothetical protein